MNENWHKNWFNEDYLALYSHRDRDEAIQHVDFLDEAVGGLENKSIIDLGCGEGRHCCALAKKGAQVTGVDLSTTLLENAAKHCKGLPITLLKQDLCALDTTLGPFDIAISMFTSFGYFSHEENQKVLNSITKILKPTGFLFLDYLDPEQVKANLVPEENNTVNGEEVRVSRQIKDGWVLKEIAFPDRYYSEQVKLYSYKEIINMVQDAGLEYVKSWKGYPQGQPRQLFLFQK